MQRSFWNSMSALVLIACQGENILEKTTNKLPTILIVSHTNGFEVQDGETQQFFATVSDDDHPYEELSITWYLDEEIVCPVTQASENGESWCEITFTEGNEKVVAEVRDGFGAGGRAEVLASVQPSSPPYVEILSPAEEQALYSNELIEFTAFVSDNEDDNADLDLEWSSSIDGRLGLSTESDTNGEITDFTMLSFGQHVIRLRAEDTTGKVTTDEVAINVVGDNYIPQCEILSPMDGAIFAVGDTVEFRANATDDNIPNDLLTVEWTSDKDGFLTNSLVTTEGDVSYAANGLSYNTHTISMVATDEVGATCTDQVLVSFTNAPQASIVSPINGSVYDVGELIQFEGNVSDVEDTNTALWIEWYSSIDGELYSGSPFANGLTTFNFSTLSVGAHVISLSADDLDGLRGEDVVVITVNTPPVLSDIAITPDSPNVDEVVTCSASAYDPDGGNVTMTFEFTNQTTGATYPATSSTGTQATLNLLATGIQESEGLQCAVTATDGLGSSVTGFTSTMIGSEYPSFTSAATITPSTGVVTGTNLICSATAVQSGFGSVTPVYEWFISGNSVGTGNAFSVNASNTEVEDVIECVASATGNTGMVSTSSDNVTVENTNPVLNAVSLSPNAVYIDTTLMCTATATDLDDDSLYYSFSFVNNTTGATYGTGTINGNTSTLSLTTVSVSPNDEIECLVFVSDSNGGSDSQSSTTTIANDPTPYFSSNASITPSSGVVTGTNLTCAATAVEAGAGNPVVSYSWQKNGSVIGSGSTLQVTANNSNVGDTIQCVASATGSTGITTISTDSVTVDNTPPTLNSVSISPSSPTDTSTITCTVNASDLDDDPMFYSFNFTNQTTGTSYGTGSVNGQYASLDLGTTGIAGGQVIRCAATVSDSNGGSDSDIATATLITNQGPSISTPSLSPSGSQPTGTTHTCSATATDPEEGSLTPTYTWYVDGANAGTGATFTTTASNSNVGSSVYCNASVSDTQGLSASANSSTANVINAAPSPSVQAQCFTFGGGCATGSNIWCSVSTNDPDDNATVTSVEWYKRAGAWNGPATFLTSGVSSYVPNSSQFTTDDWIECRATISDPSGTYTASGYAYF